MKTSAFIVFLFFFQLLLYGELLGRQTDSTSAKVRNQVEAALEETDPEETGEEAEQLLQFLEDLAVNPVNINRADLDELLQVPGVDLRIAKSILEYRSTKPFESLSELLDIKGVGQATLQRMSPYVTIRERNSGFRDFYLHPGYWISGTKADVMMRYQQDLQNKRGYQMSDSAGGYTGSSGKYYQRFRVQSRHYSVNITQEKDPGETLNGINDFDFTSGHLALRDNGKLKELVIGDYSLSFGQGLVLWSGGAFGKGREVTGTAGKNERGLRPYSSAQETGFFRGVAATYGDKLQLTAFYSNRKRTASILEGDTTRFPSSSGLHRTPNELSRRNNLQQLTTGGRLRLNSRFGLFGVTGYYNRFDKYIGQGTGVYDLYDFEGTDQAVVGTDYRIHAGPALIFGEAAGSRNGGLGFIAGLDSPLGDQTELTIAYRNYAKDFQSFLGDGFGERSSFPQNEEGLYLGVKHRVNSTAMLSAYVDQYFFPAPRFGTTQSTSGMDALGMLELDLSPGMDVYLLMKNEIRDDEYVEVNESGAEFLQLGKEKRTSVRTHLNYRVNRAIRLRSRVEWVRNKEAGEKWETGWLVYQDLRLEFSRKLRVDGRVTLFQTDSFNTRVYQFESDLLYVLSNTALFNAGQRSYAVIKYRATDSLEFWLKYALVIYEDIHTIGSGLDEIQGNRRNSIGIQVRFTY